MHRVLVSLDLFRDLVSFRCVRSRECFPTSSKFPRQKKCRACECRRGLGALCPLSPGRHSDSEKTLVFPRTHLSPPEAFSLDPSPPAIAAQGPALSGSRCKQETPPKHRFLHPCVALP